MQRPRENSRSSNPSGADVVIVGVGAVTPFGHGVPTLWEGVLAGRTAIRPVHLEGLTGDWIAGHVPGVDRRTGRHDPVFEFARAATREALERLTPLASDLRVGVVYGSCNGALSTTEKVVTALASDPTDPGVDLTDLAHLSPQAVAECVAAEVSSDGPVLALNTACASGAHAVITAADHLRGGEADVVVTGGSDALSRTALVGFRRLGALADAPARPYAADRAGMSLGEGAATLVLTTRATATQQQWDVLGVLAGHGMSADGYHLTSPDPTGAGAGRAIRAALAAAGAPAAAVGYVNGHGTGTDKNDTAEDAALVVGLGSERGPVPLSSTKSMTGHLLGAAGALEALVSLLAVRHQVCPPSAGIEVVDPALAADIIREPRPTEMDLVLSNSFAFGGANACLILGRDSAAGAQEAARDDRIVLTGTSLVSAHHGSVDALSDHLARGESVDWGVSCADAGPLSLPARSLRRVDRTGRLALAGAHAALTASGLGASDSVGAYLGTGFGPTDSLETFLRDVAIDQDTGGSPAVFPNTVYNAATGHVAQLLGLRGPTLTVASDCTAGLVALREAATGLRRGRADAAVVCALEVASPLTVDYVRAARQRGIADPPDASRLDLHEISSALCIEGLASARARGARVLGELRASAAGFGRGDAAWISTFHALLDQLPVEDRTDLTYWRTSLAAPPLLETRAEVARTRDFLDEFGFHGAGTSFAAITQAALVGNGRHLFAESTATGAHVLTLIDMRSTEGDLS